MRKILRYADGALYDTYTEQYATLWRLSELYFAGEPFTVIDVRKDEDITESMVLGIMERKKLEKNANRWTTLVTESMQRIGEMIFETTRMYLPFCHEAYSKGYDLMVKEIQKTRQIVPQMPDARETIAGFKEWTLSAGKLQKQIQDVFDLQLTRSLGAMNLATRSQILFLISQIEFLIRKLEHLEQSSPKIREIHAVSE